MSQSLIASTIPPRVREGQTVAVVAPAGPVPVARLDSGLAVLGSRYQLRMDRDSLLSQDGYLAGSDQRRADELNQALRDSDVRGILMARGGYGLTRILPLLDADALRADPIPIVGFSDGTALLSWALTQAGVRGIHGPVLTQLGQLPLADQQAFFDMLESPSPAGVITSGGQRLGASSSESRTGRLMPGNLCMFSHLVGTDYWPLSAGDIPLFEDVGERPYAVDRYLTHLASAGALSGIEAAVVGDFTGCLETKMHGSPDVEAVIAERLASLQIAAIRMTGVGHGTANRALPFGCRVRLDPGAASLELLEAAVA